MACFNRSVLPLLCSPEEEIILYCKDNGLIPQTQLCSTCTTQMIWTPCSATKYSDCLCWICPGCKATKSIRSNSLLDKQNLNFQQLIWFIHAFSNRHHTNVNIAEYTGLSEHTVSVWYSRLLTCLSEYMFLNPVVLGGSGIVVEIDESKFGIRK